MDPIAYKTTLLVMLVMFTLPHIALWYLQSKNLNTNNHDITFLSLVALSFFIILVL